MSRAWAKLEAAPLHLARTHGPVLVLGALINLALYAGWHLVRRSGLEWGVIGGIVALLVGLLTWQVVSAARAGRKARDSSPVDQSAARSRPEGRRTAEERNV